MISGLFIRLHIPAYTLFTGYKKNNNNNNKTSEISFGHSCTLVTLEGFHENKCESQCMSCVSMCSYIGLT